MTFKRVQAVTTIHPMITHSLVTRNTYLFSHKMYSLPSPKQASRPLAKTTVQSSPVRPTYASPPLPSSRPSVYPQCLEAPTEFNRPISRPPLTHLRALITTATDRPDSIHPVKSISHQHQLQLSPSVLLTASEWVIIGWMFVTAWTRLKVIEGRG